MLREMQSAWGSSMINISYMKCCTEDGGRGQRERCRQHFIYEMLGEGREGDIASISYMKCWRYPTFMSRYYANLYT